MASDLWNSQQAIGTEKKKKKKIGEKTEKK